MENKYILQNSIDTYGEKAIVDLFFEESAELTKALLKARRYGTDHERIADIVDEIADVTICLEYLKMIYKCDKAVDDRMQRINEIVRLAADNGMTYGQYQDKKTGGQNLK